jgi:energy-coupling factor transport system ATP-binding protein
MPIIEVENLHFTHSFSNSPILKGLNFAAEKRSITALIGESGCGKTTLLMALLGLIPGFIKGKLTGRIRIAGSENPKDFRKHIEPVFQNPDTQLISLKVREEILSQLEKRRTASSERRRIADSVLEAFCLTHLADRNIDNLSLGEKQRLALACALAPQPDILLLDEPLSGLDPVRRIELLKKLKEANRASGTTILIVEHEVGLMKQFADRVFLFGEGQLEDRSQDLNAVDPEYHGCCFDPDTTERIIEAESVGHEYARNIRALLNVSADLKRKECVAILGPNGAGKSTFGKCLSRLIIPTSGNVKIFGRDVRQTPRKEIARRLGITFQNPDRQLFTQSVREECLFASRNFGIHAKDADKTLVAVAKALNITKHMDRSPVTLSHGEKKRVALASMLVHRPESLFLDEPVAGLDQWNRKRVLDLLKDLHHAGIGMMLITHDLALVNYLATRVIFLKSGEKVFDGSTQEFFGADWREFYVQ